MKGRKKEILACAVNRAGLNKAFEIASAYGLAVFGTMDGAVLEKLRHAQAQDPITVCFYEPG